MGGIAGPQPPSSSSSSSHVTTCTSDSSSSCCFIVFSSLLFLLCHAPPKQICIAKEKRQRISNKTRQEEKQQQEEQNQQERQNKKNKENKKKTAKNTNKQPFTEKHCKTGIRKGPKTAFQNQWLPLVYCIYRIKRAQKGVSENHTLPQKITPNLPQFGVFKPKHIEALKPIFDCVFCSS